MDPLSDFFLFFKLSLLNLKINSYVYFDSFSFDLYFSFLRENSPRNKRKGQEDPDQFFKRDRLILAGKAWTILTIID